MNHSDVIVYASDLNSNTGEGTLGRLYIEKLLLNKKKNLKIFIKTSNKEYFYRGYFKNSSIDNQKNFHHKYLTPLLGAFKLRFSSKKYKIVFVNYLPLWNFFLFLLLPKRTILGPITGSDFINNVNNFNFFIRKYLFPLFYKISLFIIKNKFKNIIFSTDLLKNTVKKNVKKHLRDNYLYDFVFCYFQKKLKYINKYKNRKYKILFYNKNHITKKNDNLIAFINKISKNYKINIVGDKLENKKFNNLGYLTKERLNIVLKQTKFVLSSNENLLSLFNIEAINNGVIIIYDKTSSLNNKKNYIPFIGLDFNKKNIVLFVNNLFNSYQKLKFSRKFDSEISKKQKKILIFMKRFYF